MKKIDLNIWVQAHPFKFRSSTDFAYVRVANNVLGLVRSSDWGRDMNKEQQVSLALDLTLYFEDVVSYLGLWKAFISKHYELYGKYLPFYDYDEGSYYVDEVNIEDVCYLVWAHRMETKQDVFINPENPWLVKLAGEVFKYFEEEFENVPMNEELKDFIYDDRLNDIYFLKHILIWLTADSYLLKSGRTQKLINGYISHYKKRLGNISEGEVEYLSKSLTSIDSKVGPLAIRAAEWFALMCESVGLKGAAVNINEIHSSLSHVFEVISYDAENLCLRGADDNVIEISRDNFAGLPDSTLSTRKYMISAVINYQSRWFVNGMTSWSNDEEVFKSEKDRLKETQLHAELNAYEEMLAENQGRPIFYFKNSGEMMKHIERFVDAEPQFKMPRDSKSWRNIVLFVNYDC